MDVKEHRHLVDHTSLLDVNRGQQVKLEVYEYFEASHSQPLENFGPVALMLHGRSQNSNAVLTEWAKHLAGDGVHVFTMNFQGLGTPKDPGGSQAPSVMDDPFNANRADFPKLYDTNIDPPPLTTRPYTYPRWLSDTTGELAELWMVLHWITTEVNQPIHLIGYSAGAFLAGPTAMIWPDIVESLFLAAPGFPPEGLSDKPAVDPNDQTNWPPYLKALFGFPFNIQAKGELRAQWEDDQRLGAEPPVPPAAWPGFLDDVWERFRSQDPKSSWGKNVGGVVRFPTRLWWGWNEAKVKSDTHLGATVPVCIVYGSSDSVAITRVRDAAQKVTAKPVIGSTYNLPPPEQWHPGPPFSCTRLFDDIQGSKKLMVALPNTGHLFQWEKHHVHIFDYSLYWIKSQSIDGNSQGSYVRNESTGHLDAA